MEKGTFKMKLQQVLLFRQRAPWNRSRINPFLWLKVRAPRTFYWSPRPRCKFGHELHDFFWVSISSSKLHDFFVISLSSSVEICTLRSELHETRPKKSVLILIGKIRGFLKSRRFWTFFQLPVGSSTEVNGRRQKTIVKLHFPAF